MEELKISEIKPNDANPRIISDDKFEKLCQSIKDFPDMLKLRPLVIDANNVVLGGNMRLKALVSLGYTTVQVIRADSLTEDQKKEFIIKDNVGFGEWDWQGLVENWEVPKLEEWGLDIPVKFTVDEAVEDDFEIPDEIKTDIMKGDLFEIGPHRLLCGDSTNEEEVGKLMGGAWQIWCSRTLRMEWIIQEGFSLRNRVLKKINEKNWKTITPNRYMPTLYL